MGRNNRITLKESQLNLWDFKWLRYLTSPIARVAASFNGHAKIEPLGKAPRKEGKYRYKARALLNWNL